MAKAAYLEAKKQYSRIRSSCKREYENKQRESVLTHIENKDSKGFWCEINRIKSKRPYIQNEISPSQWLSYFRGLFSQANGDETEITIQEIQAAINEMKSNESPGPDGFQIEFYRNNLGYWLPKLHTLFNLLYDAGIYPEEWAKGIIVPIYKSGDCNSPNNYRPITLTSSLSKVFCSILNARLIKWTRDNCPISEGQAGFREGYSTMKWNVPYNKSKGTNPRGKTT